MCCVLFYQVPKFHFVGSETWSSRVDLLRDVGDAARDALTLGVETADLSTFDKYLRATARRNDQANPWFTEVCHITCLLHTKHVWIQLSLDLLLTKAHLNSAVIWPTFHKNMFKSAVVWPTSHKTCLNSADIWSTSHKMCLNTAVIWLSYVFESNCYMTYVTHDPYKTNCCMTYFQHGLCQINFTWLTVHVAQMLYDLVSTRPIWIQPLDDLHPIWPVWIHLLDDLLHT